MAPIRELMMNRAPGKGGNGDHTKVYVQEKAEYGAATWKLYAKISLEAFIGGFVNVFCYLQYSCYPSALLSIFSAFLFLTFEFYKNQHLFAYEQ